DQRRTCVRVAVMGAGAVGGYFGARLAGASNDVAFIARGPHLAALRRQGLTLESPQGNLHIRDARFTDDLSQVGVVDLVLFCVKSYDTEATADKLASLIGDRTIILSLQNGVDNAAKKRPKRWAKRHTRAGGVYIGPKLPPPGKIKHSSGGRIVFGELDGQVHESTQAVERVLSSAQISCEVSRAIRNIQWRKLLWN